MAALGISSFIHLRDIARDVDNIYQHPFAVSNAARSLDFHLVSMHRHMKDVVLATDTQEMERAISEVAKHEAAVMDDFAIIFERFLGDKSKISKAYSTFVAWKPIRDEVIVLKRAGNRDEAAAITTGHGANHVRHLNREVDELLQFAFKKADDFHARARANEKQAILVVSSLAILSIFAALAIAAYIIIKMSGSSREAVQRAYLIDQNIMIAHLDIDGKIVDISNALCRFLGNRAGELRGKPSCFFDNSDETEETQETIWRTISTGKEWKGEIKWLGSDGKISWASSSVLPKLDDQFNVVGYTNILVDVTSKNLSVTDKLTTLFNRRRYEEIITRELRLAKRNDTALTLAILDVDFFKNYNDRYGHPAGDKALSDVAHQMVSQLNRPNDYAFRIGGEEFALVFSGLSHEESKLFLEEIRQSISDLGILHENSGVSNCLTISIGAHVVHPGHFIDEKAIYELADKALYVAKEKRNTVFVNSES